MKPHLPGIVVASRRAIELRALAPDVDSYMVKGKAEAGSIVFVSIVHLSGIGNHGPRVVSCKGATGSLRESENGV